MAAVNDLISASPLALQTNLEDHVSPWFIGHEFAQILSFAGRCYANPTAAGVNFLSFGTYHILSYGGYRGIMNI